ncbi:MAG: hypothetical protein WC435_02425 [Candidatus Paceibacterota bacterium]
METNQVCELRDLDLVKKLVSTIETYERNWEYMTKEDREKQKKEQEVLEGEILKRLGERQVFKEIVATTIS